MEKANDNSPSNLWTRRSNSSKLSLSTNKSDRNDNADSAPGSKRFGTLSGHGKSSPFNSVSNISTAAVASPTSAGASSAFGLGSGAFASFGSAGKTPKTPGSSVDNSKQVAEKKDTSEEQAKDNRRPPARKSASALRQPGAAVETQQQQQPAKEAVGGWPLKTGWVIYYRPPTNKNSDYEKSIKPLCRVHSVQSFWTAYAHLKHPSDLPTVSDYHIFKEGIRPVWEDEENKRGGKWTMRLKKGVADRYWEELLMALIGDHFVEASEEVFSIWTKNDGGRNVKIRETIKRVLNLPADTNLQWRSHDESITQRHAVDQARQEKANQDKRRSTLTTDKEGGEQSKA